MTHSNSDGWQDGQMRMDVEAVVGASGIGRSRNGDRSDPQRGSLSREDVMTAGEVGALLRLASSSVYDLARRGAIPGHRVGRAWRFIRYEIEGWLRAS